MAPASPSAWLIRYAANFLIAARRRPAIALGLPLAGLAAGVALALAIPSRYPSSAAFVPDRESSRMGLSSALGGLAAQLGAAAGGIGDSPQFYADLLQNRTTLLPLLYKAYPADVVGEERPRRLVDLWEIDEPESPKGRDAALRRLTRSIGTMVNPRTGVITFTVEASTPALAKALADDLLAAVNDVNVRVRRGRADAQRQFMEERVSEAESGLRVAESQLRSFLTSNRAFQSPSLQFEQARLERNVDLAQTLFVNLRRELDQSAIDAARNTPSLIVITEPLIVTKRSFPKRRLVVAAVLGATLLITLAWLRLAEAGVFAAGSAPEGTVRYELARVRAARGA